MKLEVWDDFRTMERQIEDVFRPFFALPIKPVFTGAVIPPVDAFYRDHQMVVHVEIPGIDPANVQVTVEDRLLVIKGERQRGQELKREECVFTERAFGFFERRIPIPSGVDESLVKADYRDGVLEVVVPLPDAKVQKHQAIPIHTEAKG